MAPNTRISLLITSCDRHDLLRQTLESFYECTDIEPQEIVICEDSDKPMPEWLNTSIWRTRGVRWITNGCRMGQIYSCDRLLTEAKYEYIFWCEDDWLFAENGFMSESKRILDTYPNIIQVSLRGNTGWHDLADADEFPGAKFKIAQPYWRGGWGGWSFNPGLRRTADLKKLGSFGKHVSYGTSGLGHELQLSKMLLDKGYRIADLNRPVIVHLGGSRSRAIEPLGKLPRILIAVPACHKFAYSQWESEESPHYDPAKAYNGRPYGSNIHISGENPRIQAVRETWFRDVYPFSGHVDAKFFYGNPEGGHPRPALSDEVYLGCGDTYADLPLKTIEICKYAAANDYDMLFKCDDDTAVYVDRLVKEALEQRFDYAGYEHSGVCTGGPGYWLSKRAFTILAQKGGNPDHWAEDVWTGKVLNESRIRAIMLPGHKPGFAAHWYWPQGYNPDDNMDGVVTMHAVQPKVMRQWWAHEQSKVANPSFGHTGEQDAK